MRVVGSSVQERVVVLARSVSFGDEGLEEESGKTPATGDRGGWTIAVRPPAEVIFAVVT
mgnify:CR=1 FL=1|jgi:hypothetical protein